MTSASDIIQRWAEEVGKPNPRFLRPRSNIVVGSNQEIYSYGYHFTLARLIGSRETGFFLLNSEKNSVTTAQHQAAIQRAVRQTELPVILLPFASLTAAAIDFQSIRPVEILDDTFVETEHTAASADDVPSRYEYQSNLGDDGLWHWTSSRHVAGRSVFQARYAYARDRANFGFKYHRAYFVSSFDDQETNLHYFLAQLPKGAVPVNFKDAINLLRPREVLQADALGIPVTRQGDIFAVPSGMTTKDLHEYSPVTEKQGQLLKTSHTATEVVVVPGSGTYARGFLYHKPPRTFGWRATGPTHKRQKIGDGKQWHFIVKNTVPAGRSWSLIGSID